MPIRCELVHNRAYFFRTGDSRFGTAPLMAEHAEVYQAPPAASGQAL